ncbi:MFS transporter [Actinoplanes bogorensis]|uniref:MFS transporter n=1 Tax=Paractinoplanes bogorensis TaxID=1610840 RepID=A0ABS5YF19_9ACTN|nr:MFS transporter [Actinoplanes bogorensis]MBU2661931.1 MFS transporter [Actinoplanes bogorensis]
MSVDTTAAPTTTADAPHARTVLTIGSLGFFLMTLDISIVNVSLPDITRDLGGGTTGQQWTIDGYTLVFASLLISAGSLADRIGAKRALGLGVAMFTVASAGCAFAPGIGMLIAARCLQGVGAAVMLPASMALIREAYPDPRRRARALSVWAVGGAVAALIGQPLGGLLTTIDWRWVFIINLPVGIGMALFLCTVARSPQRPVPFDWPGQVLAIVALASLIFGLIEGGHLGYANPAVVGTLTAAVLALAAFLIVQARVAHPMMPLTLFSSASFRISLSVGFAFMVGNYANVFTTSLFLQQDLGLSPLHTGLMYVPAGVFAIIGNLASGRITNRFSPRIPILTGQLAMVAGLAALLVTVQLRSPLLVALCIIPIGGGGALAMPPVTGVVLNGIEPDRAGTASAVYNTFRQVGGAVAIAVFGSLLATSANFLDGMRTSLIIAAALLLVTAAISLGIRTAPAARS